MMKKYLTIFILFFSVNCFGQNVMEAYRGILRLDNNKDVWLNADGKTDKIVLLDSYSKYFNTSFVYLDQANKINLLIDLPKDSVNYYRYLVFSDNKKVLANNLTPNIVIRKPNELWESYPNDLIKAGLGTYDVKNQKITLRIFKINEPSSLREIIIYNKHLSVPKILKTEIIADGYIRNFKNVKLRIDSNWHFFSVKIKPIENIFLYKVFIKRTYKGKDEYDYSTEDWRSSYLGDFIETVIDASKFQKPGNYEVSIAPDLEGFAQAESKNAATINFELYESKKFTSKQVVTLLTIVAGILGGIAGLIIYYIKTKNKRKLLNGQQQKSITQMQLSAVRSQLNPHFMFNALAGIQSLMNKNKTEEANEYLGKFARITRNVLDNQELISLADEKALLNDYLQMEQFRFGFTYNIETAAELDLENTEIPSMLLQPFVENAVKHGIAELGTAGKIGIFFKHEQNNLILEVTDNGQGFDVMKKYQGLGLQLSKDRIALLNNIYKETPFTMGIMADEKGTIITLTLINWL